MTDVTFKPTAELRYERRVHPFDMNSYTVLQQKWLALKEGEVLDEQWWDVPIVDALLTEQLQTNGERGADD